MWKKKCIAQRSLHLLYVQNLHKQLKKKDDEIQKLKALLEKSGQSIEKKENTFSLLDNYIIDGISFSSFQNFDQLQGFARVSKKTFYKRQSNISKKSFL